MSDTTTNALEAGWQRVSTTIHDARLIAFDGCHKIYLAMDDIEARWFAEHYEHTATGTPAEMLATLHEWFDQSCGLRFISAVTRNADNPNDGFITLIEQGADWEDDDEDEEEEEEEW